MKNWHILVVLIAVMSPHPSRGQSFRFEAETGALTNVVVGNSVPGFSGTGYVTGFNNQDAVPDFVELNVQLPAGLYEMYVGYRSQYGPKGYDYRVGDQTGTGMFPQSQTFAADRAGLFTVGDGTTTLGIYEGWGFYDLDYLELRPFAPPVVSPVAPQLVDAQADYHVQVLMNYLASQYGRTTLAGQHHEQSKNLSFPVASYLSKSGGMIPAVRSSDFIEYSPTRIQFGVNPNNETEQTIAWAQTTGGVVSMMWHWNAPGDLVDQPGREWWRGFYSDATTFDLHGALANPAGADYQLLLRDIDAIAVQLQKLQDAGVPVIWHPLHEAQGGWFWWGDHGPEAFKGLWRLMHDRLTNHHGLHNLIWEYAVGMSGSDPLSPQWYPGDDVVDMVGLDVYTEPGASMSGEWSDSLDEFDGRKLIALSETGTLPDPAALDLWNISWSYFSPWKGTFVNDMTAAELQALLGDERVITLDELPALPWRVGGEFQPADFNFDGVMDADDLSAWSAAYGVTRFADANGDGVTDGADLLAWQRRGGQAAAALVGEVAEPAAVGLGALACGVAAAVRWRTAAKQ